MVMGRISGLERLRNKIISDTRQQQFSLWPLSPWLWFCSLGWWDKTSIQWE
jgi:hypothetical protein